jgi:hypothetical protein
VKSEEKKRKALFLFGELRFTLYLPASPRLQKISNAPTNSPIQVKNNNK